MVSKSLIFLVKLFWATFIDIWRLFTGHTLHYLLSLRHNLLLYFIVFLGYAGGLFSEDPYLHVNKRELLGGALLLGAGIAKGVIVTSLVNSIRPTGKK